MKQVTAVVDFGTSHTVVVVSGPGLPAKLVSVDGAPWFPSAVFWGRDGRAVVGAEAIRLARAEPARLERRPKARIGEDEVLLGDSVVPTTTLVRAVLANVIAEAIRVAGAPIQHLVLTHPADWGSTRLGALMTAAQGLTPRLSTVPEPVGAAAWFATRHELPIGSVLAVLDFGGGTCDAAVVRRETSGLSVVECAGLPDLGGDDLDQRIVEHLRHERPVLAEMLDAAEQTRPVAAAELADMARLRDNVRGAKEALSHHPQAEISLPGGLPDVLLTRPEFEADIGLDITRAAELLDGAVRSCGLSGNELTAVHLVGGSSRVPLLAQQLRARLPVPVLLDDRPEVVVALGAHAVVDPVTASGGVERESGDADRAGDERSSTVSAVSVVPAGRRVRRWAPIAAVAAIVVVVAVLATLIATGAFDQPTVPGAAVNQPGSVARLTLPAPVAGTRVEVPGHPTAALKPIKQGELVTVKHLPDRPDTQWRLDSFTDTEEGHRELVRLGNADTPGYRWILVRATEKIPQGATSYQPAKTFLVDDRGLMIPARDDAPKLPADCPKQVPTGNVAAGTDVTMCLAYLIPLATPIVQVTVASLSHGSPTNLYVAESIPNGGRVDVAGLARSSEPPPLSGDVLEPGVPARIRSGAFAADVAVVDSLTDISEYFEVKYSNDKVIGLPGTTGVLVRIAARLEEPIAGDKLPVISVSVEDDRGAVITSPFGSHRNECAPLGSPDQLTGTIVFCEFVAVPQGTRLRAVRVRIGFEADGQRVWRLS